MKTSPKFMSEMEILQEIRRNDLIVLDSQRAASDAARANNYLRLELNSIRRKKALAGHPVGQMVVWGSYEF